MEHIAQISIYAIPAFLVLIAIEFYAYHREKREQQSDVLPTSRVRVGVSGRDAASSLSLYGIGRLVKPLDKFIELPILAVASALTPLSLSAAHCWVWVLALVLADLSYYGEHRMQHRIRLFWAAHSAHHSSRHFNMSTAVRLPWLIPGSFLLAFAYVPMALLGVPLWLNLLCQSVVMLYQFPLHTERIDKLPRPIEYLLNTPSHHRVHHGANNPYLDKNYGGIFILWDRLFGSYAEETESATYGLTKNITTHNPIKVNYHEFASMLRDIWLAKTRICLFVGDEP
jgi:sterol desaturase/sphingolipid hydroxylase (fatty acid hydroxylase superfamily)